MGMGIAELTERLDEASAEAAALLQHGRHNGERLAQHYQGQFDRLDQDLDEALRRMPVPLRARWNSPDWTPWIPVGLLEYPLLRVGELEETRASPQPWSVPAFSPFIGRGAAVVLRTDARSAAAGAALLQSLVVRTAVMLPHQVRYTLVDPSGGGHAFPMRKLLQPHVRENSGYTDRDLRDVAADIRRVIDNYLDPIHSSFEQLPREDRAGERFQFVFAADFPHGYDREDVSQLLFIGNNGPKAGVYLFLHHNTAHPLPSEQTLGELRNAAVIDLAGAPPTGVEGFGLRPDGAPPANVQQRLFETLQQNRPPEPVVDWDKVVGLEEPQWWRDSSAERIEAPVGARGGSGRLRLYFGTDGEGRPCVHGLLAAMPGAGKSSLYHSLIMSLAIRYSPDELGLVLDRRQERRRVRPVRPPAPCRGGRPADAARVVAGRARRADGRDDPAQRPVQAGRGRRLQRLPEAAPRPTPACRVCCSWSMSTRNFSRGTPRAAPWRPWPA